MFAEARHYKFDAKNTKEVDQRVREELSALLEKSPGFISYSWVNNGSGEGTFFCVYEDKSKIDNCEKIIAAFIKEHLVKLGFREPVVTQGEIRAHTERQPKVLPGEERTFSL
ncbi:MAG: antibiotic biosynthesis monooxygenase [Pseudobdellovibrionaceae bacterium]